MANINFVIWLLILVSASLAEENETDNLEQQSNITKREKQCEKFIEDGENDGPSVKRDERQSSSSRPNLSENDAKILQNSLNVKRRPKIIPLQIKPTVKPKVIAKPLNLRIDTAPKRIPTKIPIVLKTGKVVPAAAHALRLKRIESLKNDTLAKEAAANIENKLGLKNEDHNCSDHAIPYSIDDKIINSKKDGVLKIDAKQTVKPVNKLVPNKDSFDCLDDDVNLSLERNGKITEDKDKKGVAIDDKKEENIPPLVDETNFRRANTDTRALPVKAVPKPVYFYEDEADSTPLLVKARAKPENLSLKHEESPKVKDFPMTRKAANKLTIEESKFQDDDPDTVHISNGTHLITIKKLRDQDKQKTESRQQTEERIVNGTPIVEKPEPKPIAKVNNYALVVPVDDKKQVDKYTDPHNKGKTTGIVPGKDPNDCIVISNRDYEEVQERTTIPPPVQTITPTIATTYENRAQDSWNYLQNLYYNPYYPNIYNQYRKYYESQDPQIYKDTNEFAQNYQNPDYAQLYNPTDNDVVYNDFNKYGDEPITEVSHCPEKPQENTLDRIWRTWKDVEIKFRNNNEDPVDIDIRRNILLDNFNNEVNDNVPTAVTQPIGINGYYNNQNSALLYPYYTPTYRYLY